MITSVSSASAALYAQWLQQQQEQSADAADAFSLLGNGAAGGPAARTGMSGSGGLQLSSDLLAALQSDASNPASSSGAQVKPRPEQAILHHHHHHRLSAAGTQATDQVDASTTSSAAGGDSDGQSGSRDSLLSAGLSA
jgi:hypothetical protein